MAEWFCHVTCFNNVYLILFFLSCKHDIFIIKSCNMKIATFYHKEVMMLSFLHRWDYCWKCEFDIDVKIENHNHHDGEQLLFYKKVHIKTQSKKKDVFVIFMLLQETKNSNLFDKNYAQENVKCHNLTWRKLTWWIVIEQVN